VGDVKKAFLMSFKKSWKKMLNSLSLLSPLSRRHQKNSLVTTRKEQKKRWRRIPGRDPARIRKWFLLNHMINDMSFVTTLQPLMISLDPLKEW